MVYARQLTRAALALFVLLACATAEAEPPVAYPQDMICDTDPVRPDRDMALHEQIAQTADGPIAYYRFGHGSPLLLITGYRATLAEWNAYFLGELAKQHQVIVFDNRGVGRSTSTDAHYHAADLARDTADLITTLKLSNATVLGWSMGGMVAQQLAIDHPERVSRLVLLSTAPPGPRSVPVSAPVEDILSGRDGSNFESIMKVLFPPIAQQRAQHCFVGDMFVPAGYEKPEIPPAVAAAQEHLLQEWALGNRVFDRLHHTQVPTLILVGMDDQVLVSHNSVVLDKVIPHATLVEVDAGGHAMMYQYPKALARRINAFIGD
jgi:pimeloyl-ACP methyl ester carboxylesterase